MNTDRHANARNKSNAELSKEVSELRRKLKYVATITSDHRRTMAREIVIAVYNQTKEYKNV
jgi:hypothetical protein